MRTVPQKPQGETAALGARQAAEAWEMIFTAALLARGRIAAYASGVGLVFAHFQARRVPPAPYKPLTWTDAQQVFDARTPDGESVFFGEDDPAFQRHQVWPLEAFPFYLYEVNQKGNRIR